MKEQEEPNTLEIEEEEKLVPLQQAVSEVPDGDLSPTQRESRLIRKYTGEPGRTVRHASIGPAADEAAQKARDAFPGNEISTAKYSLLTFLPLNLFEQLTKVANMYFLILAILQCFPAISITEGMPTLLLPLSIVIFVSMVKDFIEDRKRRNSDQEENDSSILVADYERRLFVPKRWADLRVGDVVKVLRDKQIPADLVILNSSAPKGICYVETGNLDGETNLKHKLVRKEVVEMVPAEDAVFDFRATISCELPHPALYSFEGALQLQPEDRVIPLTIEQLLLRGMIVRNTDYVIGSAIYTGAESKIQLNSSRVKTKRSVIETETQRQIIIVFSMQIAMCLACTIYGTAWIARNRYKASYLDYSSFRSDDHIVYLAVKLFGSWLLMSVYHNGV